MYSVKLIISSFLLFVYSFGFMHYLIPHCDNDDNIVHVHSELSPVGHSHHEGKIHEEDNEQHKHIQHDGHFDEGLYDFLFCFMSGIEHQENTCVLDNYTASETDSKLSRSLNNKEHLLAVLSILYFPELLSNTKVKLDKEIAIYDSPLLHLSPNKGPPIIS